MAPIDHAEKQHHLGTQLGPGRRRASGARGGGGQFGLGGGDQTALAGDDLGAPVGGQMVEVVEQHLLAVGGAGVTGQQGFGEGPPSVDRRQVGGRRRVDHLQQFGHMAVHHREQDGVLRAVIMIEQGFRQAAGGRQFGDWRAGVAMAGEQAGGGGRDGGALFRVIGCLRPGHRPG